MRLSWPSEGGAEVPRARVVRLSVLFIKSVRQKGGLEAEDHIEHIFLRIFVEGVSASEQELIEVFIVWVVF